MKNLFSVGDTIQRIDEPHEILQVTEIIEICEDFNYYRVRDSFGVSSQGLQDIVESCFKKIER